MILLTPIKSGHKLNPAASLLHAWYKNLRNLTRLFSLPKSSVNILRLSNASREFCNSRACCAIEYLIELYLKECESSVSCVSEGLCYSDIKMLLKLWVFSSIVV